MDEYNSGWDPEVKRYLKKVVNTVSACVIWLLALFTLGLFFGMAIVYKSWDRYNSIFYVIFVVSLAWMIRYLYRLWK